VELLLAMTLPALVLALTVLGVWELTAARRRGQHGRTAASGGFDVVAEALAPSKRHQVEQREHEALMADEAQDGAPPRSRIDLEGGTARLVLPSQD
jgi:hypothetical protein